MSVVRTLNNREATRLFRSWGFIEDPSPSKSAGGHKWFCYQDPDGPRASITAPGRKHGTPEVAYRQAAAIVGVTTAEFMDGPERWAQIHGVDVEAVRNAPIARTRKTGGGFVADPEQCLAARLGLLDPIDTTTLPVVEEQPMKVQTSPTVTRDAVQAVLECAEAPLTISRIIDLAGLDAGRGEMAKTCLAEMIEAGTVADRWVKGKSGSRKNREYYLVGSVADPTRHPVTDPVTIIDMAKTMEKASMGLLNEGEIEALKKRAGEQFSPKEIAAREYQEKLDLISGLLDVSPEPMTRYEIAYVADLPVNQVRRALDMHLVPSGRVKSKIAEANEMAPGQGGGRRPNLYWTRDEGAVRQTGVLLQRSDMIANADVLVPQVNEVEEITIPEEETVVSQPQPQPQPQPAATVEEPEVVTAPPTTLAPVLPAASATPTPAPSTNFMDLTFTCVRIKDDGSLVLVDESGDLYVARKVEV